MAVETGGRFRLPLPRISSAEQRRVDSEIQRRTRQQCLLGPINSAYIHQKEEYVGPLNISLLRLVCFHLSRDAGEMMHTGETYANIYPKHDTRTKG